MTFSDITMILVFSYIVAIKEGMSPEDLALFSLVSLSSEFREATGEADAMRGDL